MLFQKILRIVTNKFLIATLAFLTWISIFDRNNLFNQWDLIQKMKDLNKEKEYYIQEIKKDRQTSIELQTNLRNLEKFAREKYLMKKETEDIFLVIQESPEK